MFQNFKMFAHTIGGIIEIVVHGKSLAEGLVTNSKGPYCECILV